MNFAKGTSTYWTMHKEGSLGLQKGWRHWRKKKACHDFGGFGGCDVSMV